jgi:broad specificity phosphatase PhoE
MTETKAGPDAGSAFVVPELPDATAIWLVRHGETEWSRSGQHTGVTDLPLTENGRKQATGLRQVLRGVDPVLVLSSPRQRALDTAELAGLEVDGVTDDLAEWDYGDYEGITTAQIHESDPGWTIFTRGAPDGETPAEVAARADRVLRRAVEASAAGPVVLVGHGHMSRVLGARWVGLGAAGGAHFKLGTAAACELGAEHSAPLIVRWNIANPEAEETQP